MMQIALLALDNCLHSSVTGFYDILSVANRAARDTGALQKELFAPRIVSPDGGPVSCFNGLPLTPQSSLDGCGTPDLIYIPVLYGGLEPILANHALISQIHRFIEAKTMAAAVCAGVFVLARTGALDGREATTHWALTRDFSDRFPEVRLRPENMLVDEGHLITAGGVTAYMDLALYLIARFGSRELAALVSKSLLIDPARSSQAPYTSPRPTLTHGDPAIRDLQIWLADHYAQSIPLALMAEKAGLGQRTLARRFKTATGDTPLAYLQHLRLGAARTLLETTTLTVDQITWKAGYQDIPSFRRLFKTRTGLSPTAYRRRFSIVAPKAEARPENPGP